MQSQKRENIVRYKFIYTVLILLVYMLGRNLPLYGIDLSAYIHKDINVENLLMQTITGDIYQCSLFALGISPYMISSIIVQIIAVFRSAESKARISPKKTYRNTLVLMLVITLIQALNRVQHLQFQVVGRLLLAAKVIAVMEMITGAVVILWLSSRNKRYGIGGQTALIIVNIADGMFATLSGHELSSLLIPGIISLVFVVIVLIMENAEKRIPLQRISIHNIYADKNYLAIKLNPIGVMPVMFSTAFFMIPQMLVSALASFFPENPDILWWQENMALTKPLGIVVYLLILYGLTIGFSRVFINPKEITEQFLKSGDSFVGLHAGRETKRYLSGVIFRISFLSATVMSLCLGVPLFLQLSGNIDSTLVMFPTSVMMLTGMWCNLYREYLAIKSLETYRPFI